MMTDKKPDTLAREERLFLASMYYGMHAIGTATTLEGMAEEDRVMNERHVPNHRCKLNLKQVAMLHQREEYIKDKEAPPVRIPVGIKYGNRKSDNPRNR